MSGPRPRPVAEDRLEKRSEQGEEETPWAVPELYKGYEELLGGDTDPDFIEPVGERGEQRALSRLLSALVCSEQEKSSKNCCCPLFGSQGSRRTCRRSTTS